MTNKTAAEFIYDPEGDLLNWSFKEISNDWVEFIICYNDDKEVRLQTKVEKRQLIKGLYQNFKEFYIEKSGDFEVHWNFINGIKVYAEKWNCEESEVTNKVLLLTPEEIYKILDIENNESLCNSFLEMTLQEKKEFIYGILRFESSTWGGTTLEEFTSETIENYLKIS